MTIPWNIVTTSLPLDKKLRQKIRKLERHLKHFPPEAALFFVKGLKPEEIAMVTRQPLKIVRKTISSIQDRLREEMLAQEAIG